VYTYTLSRYKDKAKGCFTLTLSRVEFPQVLAYTRCESEVPIDSCETEENAATSPRICCHTTFHASFAVYHECNSERIITRESSSAFSAS